MNRNILGGGNYSERVSFDFFNCKRGRLSMFIGVHVEILKNKNRQNILYGLWLPCNAGLQDKQKMDGWMDFHKTW